MSNGSHHMRKRYLYAVLFAVPGLLSALLVSALLFAVTAGALWLYAFGDSPWPDSTNTVLPLLFAVVFFVIWFGAIAAGYRFGKGLEAQPGFKVEHLWYAFGATLLPVAIIVFHQLSVGNLGPASDSQLCGDYCKQQGYVSSSLPPRNLGERTCSCLRGRGEYELTVPLDSIARQRQ